MLMAGAGSAALAACGGGGDIADSGADVAGVAKAATTASPDGTVIPSATSIIDSSGNKWTLVSSRVTKNGAGVATGSPAALTTILWYGGVIYAKNSAGTWYKNGSSWTSIGTVDPRTKTTTAAAAAAPLFYGINGHMAYGTGIYKTLGPAAQLAMLKDLGVTNYRADVASDGMAQVIADALRGPFANSGVSILPVLNPLSCGWSPNASESASYTLGYNLAVGCTKVLKGLVKFIECGNELDVALKISGNGSNFNNWSPTMWPSFRGVIRGMIDGVKAIDPTINCGVNVGIPMAYGALQMLWRGITPNGTTAGLANAAAVRWDFTTYHWYHSSGDILCGWNNNACQDVLQVLKDSFGKPIWLTEWGWTGGVDSGQAAADYVTKTLTEYRSIKDKYNIQSVMMYCLVDANYGLIQANGTTKNPAYAAFKNFVAANPVS
ncbi:MULTISPECIES: glycosyl hydrolase [unclassified Caballeronia]|uniref:glycosyl hydrolase n=1 Tax=unclassified Caballeronia TaxID=2646786 RepID=UPI0028605E4E|nr:MULTISPECIES: glycosyl hydrolase [unclassified Caballeronia]MDR5753468.1 glycosyl hydrolase [Caballeronia sp. LZ024]MDR5839847.1 glycosyl hydrolase [Caballeronia sp. LZ031]